LDSAGGDRDVWRHADADRHGHFNCDIHSNKHDDPRTNSDANYDFDAFGTDRDSWRHDGNANASAQRNVHFASDLDAFSDRHSLPDMDAFADEHSFSDAASDVYFCASDANAFFIARSFPDINANAADAYAFPSEFSHPESNGAAYFHATRRVALGRALDAFGQFFPGRLLHSDRDAP
jgi:hypothetical protein